MLFCYFRRPRRARVLDPIWITETIRAGTRPTLQVIHRMGDHFARVFILQLTHGQMVMAMRAKVPRLHEGGDLASRHVQLAAQFAFAPGKEALECGPYQ